MATPGAEPALGEAGCVGVVFDGDGGDFEVLADPIGEREIVPTFNLVGFLDAAASGIDRAAEADAGRLDFITRQAGLLRAVAGRRI